MFKCIKISGGGTEDDAGDWEMTETKKIITFKRIRKPFLSWGYDGDIISLHKEKPGKHFILDHLDGTYTVYPMRNGTPFYFTPYDNNQ